MSKKTRPDLWQKIVAPNLADAFITEPQQPDLLDIIANRMLIALKSETNITQVPKIDICNGGLEITLENEQEAQLLYYALRAKQPPKEPHLLYDALQAMQPNQEPFNPGLKKQAEKFIITLSPFELNQFIDAFYYEPGLFSSANTKCTLIVSNEEIHNIRKSINNYPGKFAIFKYNENEQAKFILSPGNGSATEITQENIGIHAALSKLPFPKTAQPERALTKQTTISLKDFNAKLIKMNHNPCIQKKPQPLRIDKKVNFSKNLIDCISSEIEKQGKDFKPTEINITHTGVEFYFSKRKAAIHTMAALTAFTPEQRFLQKTDKQKNTYTGFMIPASKMPAFLQSFGFEALNHEKLAQNLQKLKYDLNFMELLETALIGSYGHQKILNQLTPAGLAINFRDHDDAIKTLLMLQKLGLDPEFKRFTESLPKEIIIKNTNRVTAWNNTDKVDKVSYSLIISHDKITSLITLLLNPQNPLESATKIYRDEIKKEYCDDYIRLLTGKPDLANLKPLEIINKTKQAESSKQLETKPEKQEIDINSAPKENKIELLSPKQSKQADQTENHTKKLNSTSTSIPYTARINDFKVLAIKRPSHAYSGELVNTTETGYKHSVLLQPPDDKFKLSKGYYLYKKENEIFVKVVHENNSETLNLTQFCQNDNNLGENLKEIYKDSNAMNETKGPDTKKEEKLSQTQTKFNSTVIDFIRNHCEYPGECPVEIDNPFTGKKERFISSEHAFHAHKTIQLYRHFIKKFEPPLNIKKTPKILH